MCVSDSVALGLSANSRSLRICNTLVTIVVMGVWHILRCTSATNHHHSTRAEDIGLRLDCHHSTTAGNVGQRHELVCDILRRSCTDDGKFCCVV